MNSSAFSNVFLSPSQSRSNSLDFGSLKIVPSDFWRRHFLVHDGSFRKLGNCDFHRGIWYFTPIGCDTSFIGFIRNNAFQIGTIFPLSHCPPSHTYSIKPRNCCVTVPGLSYSFSLNQTLASLLCLLAT